MVGFVGKKKTLLSARGFQMSVMSMEGRCSQSLQTIRLGTWVCTQGLGTWMAGH